MSAKFFGNYQHRDFDNPVVANIFRSAGWYADLDLPDVVLPADKIPR